MAVRVAQSVARLTQEVTNSIPGQATYFRFSFRRFKGETKVCGLTGYFHPPIQGGGRVVRRCWVNFQCRGVLLIWIIVGQGPIALAVGAGGGCLDIFSLICHFSFLSPSLWETARYRLKYCLKGPLSPKQPTNQPTADSRRIVVSYWRKYVHLGLVNRLGGLSLLRISMARLTDLINWSK